MLLLVQQGLLLLLPQDQALLEPQEQVQVRVQVQEQVQIPVQAHLQVQVQVPVHEQEEEAGPRLWWPLGVHWGHGCQGHLGPGVLLQVPGRRRLQVPGLALGQVQGKGCEGPQTQALSAEARPVQVLLLGRSWVERVERSLEKDKDEEKADCL